MTAISNTQHSLQAALSILSSPASKPHAVSAPGQPASANPRDEVSLSGLAQQMMKLRDANKAPEGAPSATVGIVRGPNGQELMKINEHGGVSINNRAMFEMLGGNWSDVEARQAKLEQMEQERSKMSLGEQMNLPRLPGRPGGQSIEEYLFGTEFASFSQAMRGAGSIEMALVKIQAFMPSGSGYTIEAVFERPQMPAEDAEMLAAKAAADAWRNSLRKDGERRSDAV